jgi:TrmH family RNA methyltransferase
MTESGFPGDRRFPPAADPATLDPVVYRQGPHFLLMSPRTPVNCGAAARALKNFGFRSLALVALPAFDNRDYLDDGARAAAWRALDVLQMASRPATLAAARSGLRTLIAVDPAPPEGVPQISLAEAAAFALDDPQGTGLLFGRESSGLTSDELTLCTHSLVIPSDPGYSDLNLAQAVLLVAWEIHRRKAAAAPAPLPAVPPVPGTDDDQRPARLGEISFATRRIAAWLRDIDFVPADNWRSARALLRMLIRARPQVWELSLLLGVVHQARWRAGARPVKRPGR